MGGEAQNGLGKQGVERTEKSSNEVKVGGISFGLVQNHQNYFKIKPQNKEENATFASNMVRRALVLAQFLMVHINRK